GKVERTIVLLTDFGQSCFAGIMKGVILNINENAKVIDLTHEVEPGNIVEASFILKKSFRYYPPRSIFVNVVDPSVGTARKILILYKPKEDYIFMAPDNGLLYPLIEKDDLIYEVDNDTYFLKPTSTTFHGRDIFAPISAFLSIGLPINAVASKIEKDLVKRLELPHAKVGDSYVEGVPIFADRFGNLITNIEGEALTGRKIKRISFGEIEVTGLYSNFEAAKGKGIGAVIGSFGVLELFTYLGSLKEEIPDWRDKKIQIEFED
ncbi:MAG: SAM hydrolase/SAM-dependent halogenase family protein, partial [Thermosulfidibacteraceae bacterium]